MCLCVRARARANRAIDTVTRTQTPTGVQTVRTDVGTRGFSKQPCGRTTSSHVWIPPLLEFLRLLLRVPQGLWAGLRHNLTSASFSATHKYRDSFPPLWLLEVLITFLNCSEDFPSFASVSRLPALNHIVSRAWKSYGWNFDLLFQIQGYTQIQGSALQGSFWANAIAMLWM